MLEQVKNQENIILIFFVVLLLGIGSCCLIDGNAIDLGYFVVLGYYFLSFLKIRFDRR